MVIDDMLTTGHARALLGIEDPELQVNVATRVFDEKLSVREVEKLVRKIQEKKPGNSQNQIRWMISFTQIWKKK